MKDPVVVAFTVDLSAKKVYRRDNEVHLTPNEWAVLEVLVRNSGRLMSHRHLITEPGLGHRFEP